MLYKIIDETVKDDVYFTKYSLSGVWYCKDSPTKAHYLVYGINSKVGICKYCGYIRDDTRIKNQIKKKYEEYKESGGRYEAII